jgi:tRNA pseudouridine55 synthase
VRTLAADLGRALGVPAHLAALRRTAASGFTVAQAIPLDEIERLAAAGKTASLVGRLVSPAQALAFMPTAALTASQAVDLTHGRAVTLAAPLPAGAHVRALDGGGRLVAVCTAEGATLRPVRVLLSTLEAAQTAP